MRKIFLTFLSLSMLSSFMTSRERMDQTIFYEKDSPLHALQQENDLEFETLADYYEADDITLDLLLTPEIQLKKVSTIGGHASIHYEATDRAKVNFDAIQSDSCVTLDYEYGNTRASRKVYFSQFDDKYFTSLVSQEQAKIEVLTYQLENQLITSEEFIIKREEILSLDDQEPEIISASTQSSLTTINGVFHWQDDEAKSHTLNHQKIEIVKRVYFGGVLDYPYYDTVLDTIFTTANGSFTHRFASATEELYGYYIKVYAAGDNTNVVDNNGNAYYYISEVANNVPAGSTIYYNRTFTMESDIGKAFQISQSLNYISDYAKYLNGGTNIRDCTLYYGDKGTYYDRANHIYIKALMNTSSYPNAYADWDVIGHEYGHHVQQCFPQISSNPGGTHYVNTNNCDTQYASGSYSYATAKQRGIRLSWAEGWATYFGQMYQKHFASQLQNIAYVNDDRYTAANHVNHSLLTKGYYTNSAKGDADEIAIAQVLFQLTDARKSGNDVFAYSDLTLWSMIKENSTDTFSKFYTVLYNRETNKKMLARFLADFKIVPATITKVSPDLIDIPASFEWSNVNGSITFPFDLFEIHIRTARLGLLHIGQTTETHYTIPLDIWERIVNSNDSTYTIMLSAKASQYLETGPYYTETFIFNNPVLSSQKALLRPNFYGFPGSYGDGKTPITKNHNLAGHTLTTTRLRCGYIENQYVNLSPRKQNCGTAYIEYAFDTDIYRVDVNLSFWSAREYLSSSDSTATIDYWDEEAEKWVSVVNLLDGTLPTDRTQQKTYTAIFPKGATQFRIYSSTRTIGTDNKGRISIGNMYLYY